MTTTATEKARAEYVEAIVAEVLFDNFYRLARYPDPLMAVPAIDNVAREIRKRLAAPVLP